MALTYRDTARTSTDAAFAATQDMSIGVWLRHPEAFSGTMRVFDQTRYNLLPSGAAQDINFQRSWTTPGEWHIHLANEGINKAQWFFLGLTYDGSATTNVPIFYVAHEGATALTTAATVVTDTTPVGSRIDTAATMHIGNRGDGLRPFLGEIAWLTIYDAVLSEAQMLQVMQQGFIATNLLRGYELISESGAGAEIDLAATGNATGTNGPKLYAPPPDRDPKASKVASEFSFPHLGRVNMPMRAGPNAEDAILGIWDLKGGARRIVNVGPGLSARLGENWEPSPVTGITVEVGQAVETDTALPLATSRKQKAVGIAVDTQTALAVTARKAYPIGMAVETDTAGALAATRKTLALGQAVETDTGMAATSRKLRAIGQAVETDSAQPVTARKTRAVGQAVETDTGMAVTARKTAQVGQGVETDSALALAGGIKVTLGQAAETDTALAATARKTAAVGQALETDSALAATARKLRAIGQAVETNLAQAATTLKRLLTGQAAETDTAQPVTTRKTRAVGMAVETDTGLTAIHLKTRVTGQAIETDTGMAATSRKATTVSVALEVDVALAVTLASTTTFAIGTATHRTVTPGGATHEPLTASTGDPSTVTPAGATNRNLVTATAGVRGQ